MRGLGFRALNRVFPQLRALKGASLTGGIPVAQTHCESFRFRGNIGALVTRIGGLTYRIDYCNGESHRSVNK